MRCVNGKVTPSLLARLEQVHEQLHALGVRLKHAIASVIGTAVNNAIRDLVRRLLGVPDEGPLNPRASQAPRGDCPDAEEPAWPDDLPATGQPAHPGNRPGLGAAIRTALQSGLWWLQRQPSRHPLMTTSVVTLAAGGVAVLAGPSAAACLSVVLSVAGLLLTAESATSLAGLLRPL